MSELVMTVLGPIPATDLGVTSMHEHVICDIFRSGGGPANLLDDEDMAIRELKYFRAAGGSTIVDVTPMGGYGRDLDALARVASASGVQIVAGSGFYVDRPHPPVVRELNSEKLAGYLVDDMQREGPQPGIIGEVGTNKYGATASEERSLRASARAARRTGRTVTTHAALGDHGLEQLDILLEEGLHADQIIIGHCDSIWHLDMERDLAYHEAVIARGANVGYDTVSWEEFMPDARRVEQIVALTERGHGDKIVLGSDTCRRTHYHLLGGRGYDYLLATFVPRLREAGVSQVDLDRMLIHTPRRLLALKPAY